MTRAQEQALAICATAFERGRGGVTAAYVATQAGEASRARKWAGVLTSLATAGYLRQHSGSKGMSTGRTIWSRA